MTIHVPVKGLLVVCLVLLLLAGALLAAYAASNATVTSTGAASVQQLHQDVLLEIFGTATAAAVQR